MLKRFMAPSGGFFTAAWFVPSRHTLDFPFKITSQCFFESYLLQFHFSSFSFFAAVQSLHTLNDQISHFIVTKSKALEEDKDPFLPAEKETLKSSMILMRHLLMDAQVPRSTNSLYVRPVVSFLAFFLA